MSYETNIRSCNGFTCTECGAWVPWGSTHTHSLAPIGYRYSDPKQQEILDELKAIREELKTLKKIAQSFDRECRGIHL